MVDAIPSSESKSQNQFYRRGSIILVSNQNVLGTHLMEGPSFHCGR